MGISINNSNYMNEFYFNNGLQEPDLPYYSDDLFSLVFKEEENNNEEMSNHKIISNDNIAALYIEKNKEDNVIKGEDNKYEKEGINKSLNNAKEKEKNKIGKCENKENKLISGEDKNSGDKKEKDNNKSLGLLGKKKGLNVGGCVERFPIVIDLSPNALWYQNLKKKKIQK